MKSILSLIAILIVNFATAQSDTSINIRLKQLETNVYQINVNLLKCHNQWNTGLKVVIGGVAASGLGTVLIISDANNPAISNKNSVAGLTIAGVGGLMTLVGTIIMLDSHKHLDIGRTGVSISPNGIIYKFNK